MLIKHFGTGLFEPGDGTGGSNPSGGNPPAAGEGGNPPAAPAGEANGAEGKPEGVQVPEGYELIRTEDKNNLIGQRDRSNTQVGELEGLAEGLNEFYKDREVSRLIKEHGLSDEDRPLLEAAGGVEAAEQLAKSLKARDQKAEQAALKRLQEPGRQRPKLSAEDAQSQLDNLREEQKKDGKSRLRQALGVLTDHAGW